MPPSAISLDIVAAFRASLRNLGVEFARMTHSAFASALAECVVKPAVGTPLPFDGVSLPASVTRDPTLDELERAETGITPATFAIADYGTVIVHSTDAGEDSASLHPDRNVAVVAESDVVPGMTTAFDRLADMPNPAGVPSSPRGRVRPPTWARSSEAFTGRKKSTSSSSPTDDSSRRHPQTAGDRGRER